MKSELEKLYSHIDDIEVAMMTTRRADGHLQSRAMATQKRAPGADLWFVTLEGWAQAAGPRGRPARQPVVLQGPHARVGVGVGRRQHDARPRKNPRALGARLESVVPERRRPASRDARTTRGWCSSASMCTRRCSSR